MPDGIGNEWLSKKFVEIFPRDRLGTSAGRDKSQNLHVLAFKPGAGACRESAIPCHALKP